MKTLQENTKLPNSSQKQTSRIIQKALGINERGINDSFAGSKGSLNELENQLQYMVKVKTQIQRLDLKENYCSEYSSKSVLGERVQQTGNFGHPESQLSYRNSTQRTLPAFILNEDLPEMNDLKKLQNCLLDAQYFPVDYADELKKLSAIILFRLRNQQ